MRWLEIRKRHPHRCLLTERITAHSAGGERSVEDLAVLATYPDGEAPPLPRSASGGAAAGASAS
jgi:hypothetical protein